MELISVIVPVYNVSRYLERCINSLMAQTYPDLEVILVDDGSKDDSVKMCDSYCQKYDNFKVIHKENGGLGFARNSGLEVAQGKYVTFLDGDDYLLPDHIQNLYDKLIADRADTCLGGHTKVYAISSNVHQNVAYGSVYRDEDIKTRILSRMFGKASKSGDYIEMSVCMALYSLEIIQEYHVRFYSERELISEDLVFNIDYYQYAKCVTVSDDVGYCYCDNKGSLTTRYNPDRFSQQKKLFLYLKEQIHNLGLPKDAEERAQDTFISIARYAIKLEHKFKKANGKETYVRNVKAICSDQLLSESICEYDKTKVPLKSRIINTMILKRQYFLLDIVMGIKNNFSI